MVRGVVAGTGHVVGTVYASHYWGGTYRATVAHADGSVTTLGLTGTGAGETHTHRTRLNPDGGRNYAQDDHPVTERCMQSYGCTRRALRADRWPMSG